MDKEKKRKDFWRLNLVTVPTGMMGGEVVEKFFAVESMAGFAKTLGLLVVLVSLMLGFSFLLVYKLGLKFNKA